MEAKLMRVEPTREVETGDTISLGEIVTIGRSPGNNVVLPDDQISRNHALIRREGEDYLIMDLGSANGTFVNDKPVTNPTQLRPRDVIRIGKSEFVFQHEEREFPSPQDVRKGTQRVFARVNLAILVSDVRNYAVLSPALPADGLSMILANWFRRVGECIEAHGGNIEKFRGEGVMAYWISKPGGGDNAHILGAVRAARDLLKASHEYDKNLAAQYPGHAFRIGCGIHCGDAVLGNIGADSRRDFTTLGDCVNVTFRIESLCSMLDNPVLVSEAIKVQAEPEFEFDDLGPHSLKGKQQPMLIYALRMTDT